MKDVLIYKGFEEKGLQSEKKSQLLKLKIEKHDSKIEISESKKSMKKKSLYKYNLFSSDYLYGTKVTINQFKGLRDVFYIDSENETFLYMSGKFNSSNEANRT